MATKEEHRTRAEHNEFFVSTLQNPFWDWKVCGMFYAAVHYVHTYLETKKITLPFPMNHAKRLTLVYSHLRIVFKDYEELYNESRDARYEADMTFTQGDVQRLEKKLESVKNATLPPPAPKVPAPKTPAPKTA